MPVARSAARPITSPGVVGRCWLRAQARKSLRHDQSGDDQQSRGS